MIIRFNLLLDCANVATSTIKNTRQETFDVCMQAIQRCRIWLDIGGVTPESLSMYIDSDQEANPWMQESIFRNDPDGLNALIFITLAMGHFAHHAYLQSGKPEKMSETIAEAGESILGTLVEYGEKYGLLVIL